MPLNNLFSTIAPYHTKLLVTSQIVNAWSLKFLQISYISDEVDKIYSILLQSSAITIPNIMPDIWFQLPGLITQILTKSCQICINKVFPKYILLIVCFQLRCILQHHILCSVFVNESTHTYMHHWDDSWFHCLNTLRPSKTAAILHATFILYSLYSVKEVNITFDIADQFVESIETSSEVSVTCFLSST